MNKKQAYEDKLQAQFDEWNAKIHLLKAKAEKAQADAKVDLYETIEELEKKRTEAKARLRELRHASSDAWEDLKEGIEQSCSRLSNAIKEALSRFN